MRTTIIVLLVLCVAALAVPVPVAADDPVSEEIEIGPCVTIYLDSPGVVVDPWCLLPDGIPPA